MTPERIAELRTLADAATHGPWDWVIQDHSMASLGVLPNPGSGDPLVLDVGPCKSCADRADPKVWKWGRCCTPSIEDANFIAAARTAVPELLDEVAAQAEVIARLTEALEPFMDGIAHTRNLLSIKERMHPDGLKLFDQEVAAIRTALAYAKERTP